jgi:predicted ABC-type ATPase
LSPTFYLLAGPNGAGKSTLYRAALASGLIPADIEFVNADLHEAQALGHIADPRQRSEQARRWADDRREQLLQAGRAFVSETVFSHPSKIDLLRAARAAGFQVVLLVVCVDDPQQLPARVTQRVAQGGHAVPHARILARYPRTLEHLRAALPLADLALLFDTSAGPGQDIVPPRLVARLRSGQVTFEHKPLPRWARALLAP